MPVLIIVVILGIVLYNNPRFFGKICSKTYNSLGKVKEIQPPNPISKFKEGMGRREEMKKFITNIAEYTMQFIVYFGILCLLINIMNIYLATAIWFFIVLPGGILLETKWNTTTTKQKVS